MLLYLCYFDNKLFFLQHSEIHVAQAPKQYVIFHLWWVFINFIQWANTRFRGFWSCAAPPDPCHQLAPTPLPKSSSNARFRPSLHTSHHNPCTGQDEGVPSFCTTTSPPPHRGLRRVTTRVGVVPLCRCEDPLLLLILRLGPGSVRQWQVPCECLSTHLYYKNWGSTYQDRICPTLFCGYLKTTRLISEAIGKSKRYLTLFIRVR